MRRSDEARRAPGTVEAELAARAAWLYHVGGMLQAEVAEALGLSIFRVNRLIALATERRLVRVLVDGPIAGCVALERRLADRFGLGFTRVVPEVDEAVPTRALGYAAASFLHDVLENRRHAVIGVGHGRTLAAMIQHLPGRKSSDVEFVTLLGSLPSRLSSYPFEVVFNLTDRIGSLAHIIPVPLYADSAADRKTLVRQSGVRKAFEAASRATLNLIGIARTGDKEQTDLLMGSITAADLEEVRRAGAVAEILGCFDDASGRKLDVSLHERVIALPPEDLRGREAIGIAGGLDKGEAILAILRAKVLSGLVTTDVTARALLAETKP